MRLPGGLSELFAHLLPEFFRSGSCDIRRGGATIRTAGSVFVLFATISTVVSDLDAFQFALGVKGASGMVPCSLCRNVVSARSRLTDFDVSGTLVPFTRTALSRFARADDNSIRDSCQLLRSKSAEARAGTMTPAAFDRLEKALGLKYNPTGLLFAPALVFLKIASMIMYDWMHTYVV